MYPAILLGLYVKRLISCRAARKGQRPQLMAQVASTELAASSALCKEEEGRPPVSLASAAGRRGGRLWKEWHML